jgi:hypothetical protein
VTVLEFLNSLFNPGARHAIEERQHKETTRVTHGDGDRPFALDLDARTVTLGPIRPRSAGGTA